MRQRNVGTLIQERRALTRRSQLDLASDVGVSPRHLSFVELGKARPSPELLLRIADHLEVAPREQNDWLLAAGFAPRYPETSLEAEDMVSVRRSLQSLLDAHDPFPAVVIDRRWTVQLTNRAAIRLADGIPDHARGVPSNIFRISLHPDGFAARTRNFEEWSSYLLRQLDLAVTRTGDPELEALAAEAETWPRIPSRSTWSRLTLPDRPRPVIPWQLVVDGQEMSMFTTMSTFGTPIDLTLSELTIELFFAADQETEIAFRAHGSPRPKRRPD
jgi:transcriptional regulator with XRE-family HTH domain